MLGSRRRIYSLGAFITIIALLLVHPTSRAHIDKVKEYSVERVAGLIYEGKTWSSDLLHSTPPPPVSQDQSHHKLPPVVDTPGSSKDGSASHSIVPIPSSTESIDDAKVAELFKGEKWFYEYDNELYPPPSFDVQALSKYAPHNYKGKGQPTLATFFATRNGSLEDPYFLGAQQQLYRVLWDERSKSRYPMTVFVAPFVHETQRAILRAAGANVRELPLIEWLPSYNLTASVRWRDQFSKLNFWAESEFSKIMYMDVDAFPLDNVDSLLGKVAREQDCKPNLLEEEDKVDVKEMCKYTFAATLDQHGYLNAGVFVMTPNKAMHSHLLRGMRRDRDKYDNNMIEQGFLYHVFRSDGPFPMQQIDRSWNAIETGSEDEGHVHILHEKLWIWYFHPEHWATNYFNDTWMDMLDLYDSDAFVKLRAADGPA